MKGKKKDGIGRGEIGMIDWCSEQKSRKFFSPGDLGTTIFFQYLIMVIFFFFLFLFDSLLRFHFQVDLIYV
jgi:hypothetical protein